MVFTVWEPILPTDWSKPGSGVLGRLSDGRARQFWDTEHGIADAIRKAQSAGTPEPECCERNGVLWDLAALYPPGAKWGETLPPPVFINGPVVKVAAELESALKACCHDTGSQ